MLTRFPGGLAGLLCSVVLLATAFDGALSLRPWALQEDWMHDSCRPLETSAGLAELAGQRVAGLAGLIGQRVVSGRQDA